MVLDKKDLGFCAFSQEERKTVRIQKAFCARRMTNSMQSLTEIKVKCMAALHFREHTEIHKTLAIVSWYRGVDFILKRVYDTGAGSGKSSREMQKRNEQEV